MVTTGGSHMRELQRRGENIFVIKAKKCVKYDTPVRPAGGCGCLVVARRSRYYLFIDNAAKILQQTEHSSRQQPAPVTFKLIIQGANNSRGKVPLTDQPDANSQSKFYLALV